MLFKNIGNWDIKTHKLCLNKNLVSLIKVFKISLVYYVNSVRIIVFLHLDQPLYNIMLIDQQMNVFKLHTKKDKFFSSNAIRYLRNFLRRIKINNTIHNTL